MGYFESNTYCSNASTTICLNIYMKHQNNILFPVQIPVCQESLHQNTLHRALVTCGSYVCKRHQECTEKQTHSRKGPSFLLAIGDSLCLTNLSSTARSWPNVVTYATITCHSDSKHKPFSFLNRSTKVI